MGKMGIMGGTFNPIHHAHLIIAQCAVEKYNLDKVLFITAGNPAHKGSECIEDKEHRHNMVKLAVKDNNTFEACDIEIKRHKPTYTIDTLIELSELYPEDELFFIIGTDILNSLVNWKNAERLFDYCKFVVATRAFYDLEHSSSEFVKNNADKISFFEAPISDLSSTGMRKKIRLGNSVKYLVPKKVGKYIIKHNLYKIDFFKKYDYLVEKLKINLKESRFEHTIEVAKTSQKLAIHYDLSDYDVEKAFLGGLLHDCAKCFDREKIFETAKKYSYVLDEVVKEQPELAHSFLGYFVAQYEYLIDSDVSSEFINDEELFTSIKYHTTGKADMSTIEKIVYLADYIEPRRPSTEYFDKARILAYENLDECMLYVLESTINFNDAKNRIIHPLGREAYDFYKEKLQK